MSPLEPAASDVAFCNRSDLLGGVGVKASDFGACNCRCGVDGNDPLPDFEDFEEVSDSTDLPRLTPLKADGLDRDAVMRSCFMIARGSGKLKTTMGFDVKMKKAVHQQVQVE